MRERDIGNRFREFRGVVVGPCRGRRKEVIVREGIVAGEAEGLNAGRRDRNQQFGGQRLALAMTRGVDRGIVDLMDAR